MSNSASMRQRRSNATNSASGGGSSTSTSTSTASSRRANPNIMWNFYTEDSPGVSVGPYHVLVCSIAFIGCVYLLHVWSKMMRM